MNSNKIHIHKSIIESILKEIVGRIVANNKAQKKQNQLLEAMLRFSKNGS